MKHIFILRHADTHPAASGQADFARDLTEKGKTECLAIAAHLKQSNQLPTQILCSSAVRAVSTLKDTLAALGSAIPCQQEQQLYLATSGEIYRIINELGGDSDALMVIGHNPGLHQFALMLAHKGRNDLGKLAFQFPTGSLVIMELALDNWKDLSPDTAAKLLRFVTPADEAAV